MELTDGGWGDVSRRGFVVARKFLSEEELESLRADYQAHSEKAWAAKSNENYDIRVVDPCVLEGLEEKLHDCAQAVATASGVIADMTSDAVYFAIERGIDFSWHQDHEPYYLFQETYHYLNFYIPIIKPDQSRTNLCIIPFDNLRARAPETYERFVGAGGRRLFVRDGVTVVFDDEHETQFVLNFDIDELAVAPQLSPGDLLLLRGDMIHRTEDTLTERVAVSMRRQSSRTVVSRRRMTSGGPAKKAMIAANPGPYERVLSCFAERNVDYLPAGEIIRQLRLQTSRGSL